MEKHSNPALGRPQLAFSAITSALWYGLWTIAAIGLASFTADPNLRQEVEALFPAVLIFVIIYWQLAPILVASLGASSI